MKRIVVAELSGPDLGIIQLALPPILSRAEICDKQFSGPRAQRG